MGYFMHDKKIIHRDKELQYFDNEQVPA